MKIFEKLEEHAHLLLQELRQHMLNQMGVGNKINENLHDFVTHLETHVNSSVMETPPQVPTMVVTPEPVETPPQVPAVVETPAPVETPSS